MTDRSRVVLTLILGVVMMGVVAFVSTARPDRLDEVAASRPITFRIDPNQADTQTLCLLPGIAKGKARAIVDDRDANGPFASAQEMERVSGIAGKIRAAITPWITLESSDPQEQSP